MKQDENFTEEPVNNTTLKSNYDARQGYTDVLRDILENIAKASATRNLYQWLTLVDSLYMITQQYMDKTESETLNLEIKTLINEMEVKGMVGKNRVIDGNYIHKLRDISQKLMIAIKHLLLPRIEKEMEGQDMIDAISK